jgi:hypothetical protein
MQMQNPCNRTGDTILSVAGAYAQAQFWPTLSLTLMQTGEPLCVQMRVDNKRKVLTEAKVIAITAVPSHAVCTLALQHGTRQAGKCRPSRPAKCALHVARDPFKLTHVHHTAAQHTALQQTVSPQRWPQCCTTTTAVWMQHSKCSNNLLCIQAGNWV